MVTLLVHTFSLFFSLEQGNPSTRVGRGHSRKSEASLNFRWAPTSKGRLTLPTDTLLFLNGRIRRVEQASSGSEEVKLRGFLATAAAKDVFPKGFVGGRLPSCIGDLL